MTKLWNTKKRVITTESHCWFFVFVFYFFGFLKMCGKLWLMEYIVRLLLWFSHGKKTKGLPRYLFANGFFESTSFVLSYFFGAN